MIDVIRKSNIFVWDEDEKFGASISVTLEEEQGKSPAALLLSPEYYCTHNEGKEGGEEIDEKLSHVGEHEYVEFPQIEIMETK